ncbi:MAG: argininosuccinate lyase [Deltaproteobacteria bacterium]|nr:argininosuccinate lyase [Deltaproteobacteria bacterium]
MSGQKKPWGGRFSEPTDKGVEEFTSSLHFDRRLYAYDIAGSIAHCRMLAAQGIVSSEDAGGIISGLQDILKELDAGTLPLSSDREDIHMAIEAALIARIGQVGGKLHTARSRNDQVSLDIRLYLRDEVEHILDLVADLQGVLVRTARREIDTVLPGYTHLQRAQPVLLAHYLLAYWEMLDRDAQRLKECRGRINVMPLGSAALAGTGFPIDRDYVARLLDFPAVSKNSMDAVSDRDFVAEFIFDASMLMMHMSRFCEDLILWSGAEFGFVDLSDAFTTGSSIMPQKKNPDVAELIRGKTGRVYGDLTAILTVLKGLPMTYDRDLQEDKEPLFDAVDTVTASLAVLADMTENMTFNRDRMLEAAGGGFSTATDVADYLVMKGVPFREAHGIVGRLVGYCVEKGKDLPSLTIEEIRLFWRDVDTGIYTCMRVEGSINARNITGGTAREAVLKRIAEIESTERKIR